LFGFAKKKKSTDWGIYRFVLQTEKKIDVNIYLPIKGDDFIK